jgi:transposase
MARYGNEFKARAVARLLPPESAPIPRVSQEIGVSVATLERWMSDALSRPAPERAWTAAARLEPEEARASPQETREDRRRIKELERDLRRKEKALAETAALLVLSKKLEALFQPGGDE